MESITVDTFVTQLNDTYKLGLTERQVQQSAKVLRDQWFQYASELAQVDADIFSFLDLHPSLIQAIVYHFGKSNELPKAASGPGVEQGKHISGSVPLTASSSSSSSLSSSSSSSPFSSSSSLSAHKSQPLVLDEAEDDDDYDEGNGDGPDFAGGPGGSPAPGNLAVPMEMVDAMASLNIAASARSNSGRDVGGQDEVKDFDCAPAMAKSVSRSGSEGMEGIESVFDMAQSISSLSPSAADPGLRGEEDDDDELDYGENVNQGGAGSSRKSEGEGGASMGVNVAICGVCKKDPEDPLQLNCNHLFCTKCVASYIMDKVAKKEPVGIACPRETCHVELLDSAIKKVLSNDAYDSYLQATLMAFVDADDSTFKCPKMSCRFVMSTNPTLDLKAPAVITEKDQEGKVLSTDAWFHYKQNRMRCPKCSTVFCSACREMPYHMGYNCDKWKIRKNAPHCRYCDDVLDEANTNTKPISAAFVHVCTKDECAKKISDACIKCVEPCKCPCSGIRDELTCAPCLEHELYNAEYPCGICVEALSTAPCVQLTGDCKHSFHIHCLREKLNSKWSGANVNFVFMKCGQCRQAIDHPALASMLAPLRKLEKQVSDKAVERLKYEGREKDKELITPGGEYYKKEAEYAMKLYVFYMCHECQSPYFAGGYQCQEANAEFDPAELICSKCQPGSMEECDKHGKEFLLHKCRYCCNIASFFCWGTSRFCTKCHKSGTWQNLAIFRSGKNKKRFWEYEQCPGLKAQMDKVLQQFKHLSDDDKEKKLEVLVADPLLCPIRKAHPPNGMEYGLGCTLCDPEPVQMQLSEEEKVKQRLIDELTLKAKEWKKRILTKDGVIIPGVLLSFHYTRDFDYGGLFYYLGVAPFLKEGSASLPPNFEWVNPCDAGLVSVLSSELANDSAPASAALSRTVVRCVTKAHKNSFFTFDLKDMRLAMTHYTLRHYNSWDTECLRFWILEGSIDGKTWELICSHNNDSSLSGKGSSKTWKLPRVSKPLRFFRITQTGKNSNNNHYLPIGGIEFYGQMQLLSAGPDAEKAYAKSIAAHTMANRAVAGVVPSPSLAMNFASSMQQGAPARAVRSDADIMGKVKAMSQKYRFIKEFIYNSDFDTNGIIYFMGTQCLESVSFVNPAENDKVIKVTCSQLQGGSNPSEAAHFAVGRTAVRCVSVAQPNQSFTFDFKQFRILPTHYSLRHYSSWDLEALRTWKLQASNDGIRWCTIKSHENDASLHGMGATASWALDAQAMQQWIDIGPFSHFRIFQHGKNSNDHYYLAISGIEFYGYLFLAPASANVQVPPGQSPVPEQQQLQQPQVQPQLQQQQQQQQQLQLQQQQQQPQQQQVLLLQQQLMQRPRTAVAVPQVTFPAPAGPVSPLSALPPSGMLLKYSGQDFDQNGLFQFLGTDGGVRPWTNPAETGLVSLAASSIAQNPPCAPISAMCAQQLVRLVTLPKKLSWWAVDLLGVRLAPTHYSLKHYNSWDMEAIRTWKVFGSNNGVDFDLLSIHFNDDHLNKKGATHTWEIQPAPVTAYRMFLLLQTGPNSNSNDYFSCSGLEFYGTVYSGVGQPVKDPSIIYLNKPIIRAVNPLTFVPPLYHSATAPVVSMIPAMAGGNPGAYGYSGLAQQTPVNVEIPLPPPNFKEKTFIWGGYEHFDENGIIYFLGTHYFTRPWSNPGMNGTITCSSSPLATKPPSWPAYGILSRKSIRCVTAPYKEGYFQIDFNGKFAVCPTHYALRHYDSWDLEALRDWKLQGSNDGLKWTKLLHHKGDENLQLRGSTHTWQLPRQTKSYSMFRLLQTGPNSNQNWYLAVSGWELYGSLTVL